MEKTLISKESFIFSRQEDLIEKRNGLPADKIVSLYAYNALKQPLFLKRMD